MRLRFDDLLLERFYVSDIPPDGVENAVLEHCLDALAVLVASGSVADFRLLEAFRPVALRGKPPGRLALPLGGEWALVFRVEAEGRDEATARITSLSKSIVAARRSSK